MSTESELQAKAKVFLSYSWTSAEHQRWVRRLAEDLEGAGIHVVFDQYDLRPGQNKYVYMENMVLDPNITKILVISDRIYAEKANGREGGVGTETVIMSREVYERTNQQKVVALVTEYDDNGQPYLPVFLRDQIYLDFSAPDRYHESLEALIRNVYDKPEYVRPKRGVPPRYILEADSVPSQTRPKFEGYRHALLKDSPASIGYLDDYLGALEAVIRDMLLPENGYEPEFRNAVLDSISSFLPYRDEFVELVSLVAQYSRAQEPFEHIHRFFEQMIPYDHIRHAEKSDDWTDNIRFVIWELFLYTIALLIRRERFDGAALLLNRPYFYSSGLYGGTGLLKSAGAFDPALRSLEDRERRSKEFAPSLIRKRATRTDVAFEDLVQADYLIFLQTRLNQRDDLSRDWYPRLLGGASNTHTLNVFSRASSREFFDRFKAVLGVQSRDSFLAALQTLRFPEVENFWGGSERHFTLVNAKMIATQ